MSEGHLEVIHLDDEENENSDEEDTEEEEDGDTDDPSPENDQEEVVVLGESDATSSSSESGDDEESESPGDEAALLSDQDEIQILSDDDANDISNNAEEPVIVLGSVPINLETCSKESAKPSTSLGSQLPPNSCSDVNYEDFDCFVDPEDESQTSTKRTEETQPSLPVCTSNNHPSPSPCNEVFLDYEEFRDTALEDELTQLSSSEDEDQPVGDDLSRSLAHAPNPQVANEDISDIGFKIFERDIFVGVSTLKSMIPNVEMNDLLKSMENKGWKISECVKFCGWEMQYICLELAKYIIPKQCLLGKLIHHLNPNSCIVNASKRIKETIATPEAESEPEANRRSILTSIDPGPGSKMFEVTQTREMKRKGIKLPRGWKIFGIKRQYSTSGDSYQYFRIDWEFKSPEGKVYNDLKKVMSIVKQKASRYEKWEVYRSKKTSGIDAGSGHYVTLKQQFEDELDLALDTDVFAVSGVRPLRKFPLNFQHPSAANNPAAPAPDKGEAVMPSRMSAMIKSNPISLAQREKMMRKAGPAIRRFQLSKVSEVSGVETDGWFTSKLIAMKFISKCKDYKCDKFQVYTLPKTDLFLDSDRKVLLKFVPDEEIEIIEDLQDFLKYVEGNDKLDVRDNFHPKTSSRSSSRVEILLPNFDGKVVQRLIKWPKNWLKKQDLNLTSFISPEGASFADINTAVGCMKIKTGKKLNTSKKSFTPNKRKLFNLELPQKTSSVIRKLPTANDETDAPLKKLKLSDTEIEAMVSTPMYDSSDSVDDLLSGSGEDN